MNITPTSSPRLFCRIVRQWSSVVAGGGAHHAESCADCRTYFASAGALDASLRRDAGVWAQTTPAPSVGFERRILGAVMQSTAPATAARPRVWRGAWAATGAVAAIVALAVFGPASGPTRATNEANAAMLTGAVQAVSRGLVEKVIPSTGALVADNPLQREFDAIYADARSALGFLALNFLPASTFPAQPM